MDFESRELRQDPRRPLPQRGSMTNAIQPPYSADAEQAVLGGLMLDNESIDRIGDLKSGHFFVHENRVAFDHIQRLIAQQRPADVLTVMDAAKLAGDDLGLPYLNALAANTPSAANISRYAEIVKERALERGILIAAQTAREIVSGPPTNNPMDTA
ncbi:hypothetical protein E4695_17320, partial [Alcaligenaceae bacterium 429]